MTHGIHHTFQHTSSGQGLFYGWFEAMHSRLDLLLIGPQEHEAANLCETIAGEIRRIEKRLNRFDETSDIARLNLNCSYETYPAEPEILDLCADALRYRELTSGAFDVCIQTPGYRETAPYFSVDYVTEAIIKHAPDVIFDFGGYGKGYALRRIREVITAAGISSALVSFGNSSVCGIGRHPTGRCWEIGVTNPLSPSETLTSIALHDSCMSSSGNTPRNRGHIHSPHTAEAITDDRIVTVSGLCPLECEVISTALFAATEPQQRIIQHNFTNLTYRTLHFTA